MVPLSTQIVHAVFHFISHFSYYKIMSDYILYEVSIFVFACLCVRVINQYSDKNLDYI